VDEEARRRFESLPAEHLRPQTFMGARHGFHALVRNVSLRAPVAAAAILLLTSMDIRVHGQSRTIGAFFDDFSAEWMRRRPSQSTGSRYFTGAEQDRLDRQLTPETSEWRRETVEQARRGLQELARFDRSRLTDAERVSADVMQWQLQIVVDGEPFSDYDFPLDQFDGANVRIPNLLTVVHPVRTEGDARNYVAWLREVDDRMAEASEEAARLAAKGIRPPRFILQSTIAQMQRFVGSPAAENPLVATFVERMNGVQALSVPVRQQLTSDATSIVEHEVYPAWRKAISLLEAQLKAANDDAGLWRYKDGAAIYAYRLKQFTTTTMTAAAIHALGLREVSRIEGEMDAILRKLGRTEGTVKQRMETLAADLSYPSTSDGRARIMADIDRMIRDADTRSNALFDLRPKSPVIAQPYPEFRWASAAASYTAPPLDGSRPGIFQMPLRPSSMTKASLRTLVYHETIPGHHFQVAFGVENRGLPKFRQVRALGGISAISEGWALYAERMVAQEGWYEGDLEGLLGQLDDELFRARRLVVDTGLHAMRWTRQQAIDYGIEPSEVERYVVNPGQACSYKIGQLEIFRLRDKARTALGQRFTLKEFHNVMLSAGSVPLTILEREVDAYIARKKAV
jgi:uncharacterized protein (DUF885 family)